MENSLSAKIKRSFPVRAEGTTSGRKRASPGAKAPNARFSFFFLSPIYFSPFSPPCPRQKPDTLLAVRFPALLTIYVNSAGLTRAPRSYRRFLIARARSPTLALVYLTGGARPSEQRRATTIGTGWRNGVQQRGGRKGGSPPFFRFSTRMRGSPPIAKTPRWKQVGRVVSRRSRPRLPIVEQIHGRICNASKNDEPRRDSFNSRCTCLAARPDIEFYAVVWPRRAARAASGRATDRGAMRAEHRASTRFNF